MADEPLPASAPSPVPRRPAARLRRPAPSDDDTGRAIAEVMRLVNDVIAGRLDARGDVTGLSEDSARLVEVVNRMIDALVQPLRTATRAIDQIAHGRIPDFIVEEYPGEFNDIKRNVNTFLATMYGMHHEMQNLVRAITEGRLKTRGNDWDFEGNWRELVSGVNSTLDAVIGPMEEARVVLGRLSQYDLTATVQRKYRGEHARIKQALNATTAALHQAIAQVADSVSRVQVAGGRIAEISQGVATGAAEQAHSTQETSASLEAIERGSARNADSTEQATVITKKALDAARSGTDAASRMIEAIQQIRTSAENSLTIVQEINGIAQQTDQLAGSAAIQAAHVGEASRGFSVVAQAVRDLAGRSREAAMKIEALGGQGDAEADPSADAGGPDAQATTTQVVREIDQIAIQTNMLATNAAIEAAHVEAAGLGLQEVTDKVRGLAQRSKDAANRTGSLLAASARLSADGSAMSDGIGQQLLDLVDAVQEVAALVEDVARASQDQRTAVERVTASVASIAAVTQRNADGAQESSMAADDLVREGRMLESLVGRFRIHTNGTGPVPASV